MSIKRVVGIAFWDDEKVVNEFTPEDKYFFLYLLTNPRSSMLGIYKLVPKLAAFEMGYSVDAILALIERFETKHKVIRYNRETCEVAIKNYLRHSIVKGGKPIYDRLVADLKQVNDKSLMRYIRENLTGLEDLNQTVRQFLHNTKDGDTTGQYVNIASQLPTPEVTSNVPKENGNGSGRGNGVTPSSRKRNDNVTSDDDHDLPFGLTPADVFETQKAISDIEESAKAIGLPFAVLDVQRVEQLAGDYGFDWVQAAIKRTSLREKRSWGTVMGILRSWKAKGGIDDEVPQTSASEGDDSIKARDWVRGGKRLGE